MSQPATSARLTNSNVNIIGATTAQNTSYGLTNIGVTGNNFDISSYSGNVTIGSTGGGNVAIGNTGVGGLTTISSLTTHIGTLGTTTVNVGNTGANSGSMVNIGLGATGINIGTGSTGTVTIGNANGVVRLNGPLTLGSAPTSSSQLGYSYADSINNSQSSSTTTTISAYSPTTGLASNYLSPGIYLINVFISYYNSAGTTTGTSLFFGLCYNSTTNPNTGSVIVSSISGGYSVANPINSLSFSPSFVFTVTTSAYYYGYVTSSGATTTGSYTISARTLSMTRIA